MNVFGKSYIIIILIFLLIPFITQKHEKKVKEPSDYHPKISIYLPIYNSEIYLERSIGSLQKQTLKDIEIIAVNDCSTDNSYNILKNFASKDERIKIVNSTENRGLLYARAMGIINSNGEYIMDLDPDDEISNKNDLEYLYLNTNNSQIDILNFGMIINDTNGKKKEYIFCRQFNETLLKPKLFDKYVENPDFFIYNKIIKKEIYLKAYETYKDKIYGEKINYADDEVWSGLVNRYANSKKCLERLVYIYHRNKNSLSLKKDNYLYCLNLIDWNEMFIYHIFSGKDKITKAQTLRFLDLIRYTTAYFNIIKSNNILSEKYIKYLTSIRSKFSSDNFILNKIKSILEILTNRKFC